MVLVWTMLFGIAAWRAWEDRAAWIERDNAETANLVRSLAQHAHDAIQAADTAVVDLRGLIEIEGTTPRTLRQLHSLMATQLAASPVISAFVVFDAAGNWIVNSRSAPPYNVADRAYFQYHRSHADRGVHIGDPVRSKATGKWVVTTTRRVDAPDGSFAGVMLATMPVEMFLKFYGSFDVGRQGTIALLTAEGTIVTRTQLATDVTGQNVTNSSFFQEIRANPPSRVLDYVSPRDGVHRLGSYQRMEDFPYIVMVTHGFDEALSRWRANTRVNGAVSLVASAVVLLLGIRLARQIRRSEQAEDALAESEGHYRMIAQNSTDVITRLDASLRRTYVSPSSEAVTGYRPQELLGGHPSEFVHPEDWPTLAESLALAAAQGEAAPVSFRFTRKDGAEVWLESTGRRIADGHGYVIALRDVTRRKESEVQLHSANNLLQRLVMQDALTGIANRRCFDLTLQKEIRRQARADSALALLLIDVDHFKRFNDAYGHSAGDTCLRAIAEAMTAQMKRPADLVSRFGGEEFAIVLPDTDLAGAMALAERVRWAVRLLDISHRDNAGGVATVSIGVAVGWPRRRPLVMESLIKRADEALYQAKEGGRDRVVLAIDSSEPTGIKETQPSGAVVVLKAS